MRDTLAPVVAAGPARPLSDLTLYLFAQATDLAGDPAAAAPLFHALGTQRTPFAAVARWREADCLHDAGRLVEAAAIDRALLAHHAAGGELAVALWDEADADEASGDRRAALAHLHRLYVEDPGHPLADRALARSELLSGATPAFTPVERLARARTFDALHRWDRAERELALLPPSLPEPVRVQAELLSATMHYHARDDYARAATEFLDAWPHLHGAAAVDALFHGARSLSRANHDDEAIGQYQALVARFPQSGYAAEAQYLAGWLDYNRGRYRESLPALERVVARYGHSSFSDPARFCLGFSHFLLGEPPLALPFFRTLAARPSRNQSERGGYWTARTLEELGDRAAAREQYQALVVREPFSWYALLARSRLETLGAPVGPFGGAPASAPTVPDSTTAGSLAAGVRDDPLIARVDLLIAAGFGREASAELAAGAGRLLRRLGAAQTLPALFDRFWQAGDFHHPHDLAELYGDGALDRPPVSGADLGLWRAAFPQAYRPLVEQYGPNGGNPPDYLYAIMRQESAFNPDERSYAEAIGLLQMIPPTSRRVGQVIGVPYSDDVLYDPAGNVRFGAWYIGHLVQKFRRQIPLAAGSFNAGPIAMMRWCREHGGHPTDEFVELVPYAQTRDYIERVTANYARYVWLYEHEDYAQPLAIDPSYDESDGIDY